MDASHAEKSQPRRPRRKARPIPRWRRILRLILRSSLLAYIVVFALSLLLTRYMAESWWVTTLALYSAPTIWLLPMALLIPAAIFLERKQLLVYPILVFFLLFASYNASSHTNKGMSREGTIRSPSAMRVPLLMLVHRFKLDYVTQGCKESLVLRV